MVQKMVAILLIIGAMVIGEIGCVISSTNFDDEPECLHYSECPPGWCCRLPLGERGGRVRCMAETEVGRGCDPKNEIFRGLILAANGEVYNATGIYREYCPCLARLVCRRTTSVDQGICEEKP